MFRVPTLFLPSRLIRTSAEKIIPTSSICTVLDYANIAFTSVLFVVLQVSCLQRRKGFKIVLVLNMKSITAPAESVTLSDY